MEMGYPTEIYRIDALEMASKYASCPRSRDVWSYVSTTHIIRWWVWWATRMHVPPGDQPSAWAEA